MNRTETVPTPQLWCQKIKQEQLSHMRGILPQCERPSFVNCPVKQHLTRRGVDGPAYLQCTECCREPALKEEAVPAGRLKKDRPFGTDYTQGMLLCLHPHLGKREYKQHLRWPFHRRPRCSQSAKVVNHPYHRSFYNWCFCLLCELQPFTWAL